jgi:hypothetical protein
LKTIQIDPDIFAYLEALAAVTGETPAQALRRELNVPAPPVSIEVDDEVFDHLVSKTTQFGESASSVIRRELRLTGESDDHDAAVQEFHIRAGTGANAWNTPAETLVLTVGDTLRITNEDAVPHRLHTSGVPFAHALQDVQPGGSQDYVARTAFDAQTGGSMLYDHNFGPAAAFHLKVLARA